jgi:putative hydrolase of the HAD superfamily
VAKLLRVVEFLSYKGKRTKYLCDYLGLKDENELLQYFLRRKHDFESHENIADYLKDKGLYDDELFKECCQIYEVVKLNSIKPYPNVDFVLKELKSVGLKLAVVTDALNGNAIKRLKKAKLIDYFDVIVSADMTGKRKA